MGNEHEGLQQGFMKQLLNNLSNARIRIGGDLAARGLSQSPASGDMYRRLEENIMAQAAPVLGQIGVQQAQGKQAQGNFNEQMAQQMRQFGLGQDMQRSQMGQQAAQFGKQFGLATRQQDLSEKQLAAQLDSQRWQEQNAWMGPLAGILGMGMTPARGGNGWLLQLLGNMFKGKSNG